MEGGKKILVGLIAIIVLNYGGSLVMSFFGDVSAYDEYITWTSFLIIMWMFLSPSSDYTFDDE